MNIPYKLFPIPVGSPAAPTGVTTITNVRLGRIIVEDYDDTADETITLTDGDDNAVLELTVEAGQVRPLIYELDIALGNGFKVGAGDAATDANISYFVSSNKIAIPNAGY